MPALLAFLKRYAGAIVPVLVAAAIIGLAFAIRANGYRDGANAARAECEQQLRELANQAAAMERMMREAERQHIEQLARIDQEHQETLRHAKAEAERTIADLRAGNIRLRERFTCPAPAGDGVPEAAAGSGRRDARASGGLSTEDAEFLLRLAAEADEVTRQLQACQAVVRSDRWQQSQYFDGMREE